MLNLINRTAPDIALLDQDNVMRRLRDYRGQYVLLYFYPKDMTPGCTVEATGFRDALNDLRAAGVQVLGVSADTCQSHKKFARSHQLNFPLLADTEQHVVKAYGVWTEKSLFGRKYFGIQRDSFLIDPAGRVVQQYEKVRPDSHPADVLKDVQALTAAARP